MKKKYRKPRAVLIVKNKTNIFNVDKKREDDNSIIDTCHNGNGDYGFFLATSQNLYKRV